MLGMCAAKMLIPCVLVATHVSIGICLITFQHYFSVLVPKLNGRAAFHVFSCIAYEFIVCGFNNAHRCQIARPPRIKSPCRTMLNVVHNASTDKDGLTRAYRL